MADYKHRSMDAEYGPPENTAAPMALLQLKASLAGMSYDEQVRSIQPDLPLGVVIGSGKSNTSSKVDSDLQMTGSDPDTEPAERITVDIGGLSVAINPEGLLPGQLFPRGVDEDSTRGVRNRESYESIAGNRLVLCLGEFNIACRNVENELIAAARSEGRLLGSLAGIAMGFAIPAVGAAIQRVFQRAAVQASLSSVPAQSVVGDWLSLANATPTIVNGASSAARRGFRNHVASSFSDVSREIAILESLREAQVIATDLMQVGLPSLTDDELLATVVGYNPASLLAPVYEEHLRRFLETYQQQVESLDVSSEAAPGRGHYSATTTVARIRMPDGNIRLAQVRTQEFHTEEEAAVGVSFRSWVPENMADAALARAEEIGAPILFLQWNEVRGMPDGQEVDSRLPEPPSHYDYVRRPVE